MLSLDSNLKNIMDRQMLLWNAMTLASCRHTKDAYSACMSIICNLLMSLGREDISLHVFSFVFSMSCYKYIPCHHDTFSSRKYASPLLHILCLPLAFEKLSVNNVYCTWYSVRTNALHAGIINFPCLPTYFQTLNFRNDFLFSHLVPMAQRSRKNNQSRTVFAFHLKSCQPSKRASQSLQSVSLKKRVRTFCNVILLRFAVWTVAVWKANWKCKLKRNHK